MRNIYLVNTRALFEQSTLVTVFTNLDSLYRHLSSPPNTRMVAYVKSSLINPPILYPHGLDKSIPNLTGISTTTMSITTRFRRI